MKKLDELFNTEKIKKNLINKSNMKIDLKNIKSNNIIDAIQTVRSRNNDLWMSILRLSFKYAPEETKNIFKQITENDKTINKYSKELCK